MRYRAYLIADDDTVREAMDLRSDDEQGALEESKRLEGFLVLEVWEVSFGKAWDRLVRRWEPLARRRRQHELSRLSRTCGR